jgi:hypothetical protein
MNISEIDPPSKQRVDSKTKQPAPYDHDQDHDINEKFELQESPEDSQARLGITCSQVVV